MLLSAGSNAHGQLSNGSTDDSHVFRPCSFEGGGFPDGRKLVDLAFGANHTLALLEDLDTGKTALWGCGDGRKGQLGPSYTATTVLSPLHLPFAPNLAGYAPRLIAAAWETSYVALSAAGKDDILISMGFNAFGVLGVGLKSIQPLNVVDFKPVLGGRALHISAIAAGPKHVVALLRIAGSDDLVVGWGASRHGQLGDATTPFATVPTILQSASATSAALGHQHTLLLNGDGSVGGLGSNRKQQLEGLDAVRDARSVHCTWNGSYIVATNGHILSAGSNIHGQLGRDTLAPLDRVTFPFNSSTHKLLQLACGSEHVLAAFRAPQLTVEVWGWGWNEHGNLGSGTTDNALSPQKLRIRPYSGHWRCISACRDHTPSGSPTFPLTTTHIRVCRTMSADKGYNTLSATTSNFSNDTDRYLGVTPPIATNESTEREKEATTSLMEELRRQSVFETEEQSNRSHIHGANRRPYSRELVLGRVAALVKSFVRKVSLLRGLTEQAANAAGGKIFTYGSYRLGVHGPGSDINILCVVPMHVARQDFFDYLEPMLKEMNGVTAVSGVPDAYVPIIRAKASGVLLDLSIACLALPSIPDNLSLQDDTLLRNLDERCVRSLGGSRMTDEILRLVPNVQVFRDALRCIRLWAQRRAIYSNVNGFLGGVAWALLVARICQLYPNAVAGAIVSRFFLVMYRWSWPQPVLLKQIEEGPVEVRIWNPMVYPADRSHRMPIITPAFPAMCATHNVTASTQMIMTEELKTGADTVDRVIVGKATWAELFAKHDFFHQYRYYLQVIASTGNADLQLKWAGMVESRIRQLVMKLEYVESLILAHPFTRGFEQTFYCISDEEVRQVAQGTISDTVLERKVQGADSKYTGNLVYSTTFYVGLAIEPRQAGTVGPRQLDISYPTQEFVKLLRVWEQFEESSMSIVVQHIKSSALPNYVFDPGERGHSIAGKRPKV
ncbi:Poly(A) polymerase [Mycena kentingensis (nom. inval.)]|nr:Poly(A) polymerase [Mycena kentingensis (nom. inval.)]